MSNLINSGKRRVMLILTVGSSLEPLEKAISHEYERSDLISVVALYGRPLPGQNPNPLQVTNRLEQIALQLGSAFMSAEISDAEDVDVCLQEIREEVNKVFDSIDSKVQEVVVNITGGSKPMPIGIYNAVARLATGIPIRFSYVASKMRDASGKGISATMNVRYFPDTLTREREYEVLDSLKHGEFTRAYMLSEMFEDSGKGRLGFLKHACKFFYLWDSFQYKESYELLAKQYLVVQGKIFEEGSDYRKIANLIEKLEPLCGEFKLVIEVMGKLKPGTWKKGKREVELGNIKKAIHRFNSDFELKRGYEKLVADCIENAGRQVRISPVEAVAKAHRAIDLAAKYRLLLKNINPDHTDNAMWNEVFNRIGKQYDGPIQRQHSITLQPAIKILGLLGALNLQNHDSKYYLEKIRDVYQTRNASYFGHGFTEISEATAQRIFGASCEVLTTLIDVDELLRDRAEVALDFD